jgi:hypothetical protein
MRGHFVFCLQCLWTTQFTGLVYYSLLHKIPWISITIQMGCAITKHYTIINFTWIIYGTYCFRNYFKDPSENKVINIYAWLQTFTVFWTLYAFFWVIPQHLNFIFQHFRTLCLFHLPIYLPMKMEQADGSETLAYKIGMQGNFPEESMQ